MLIYGVDKEGIIFFMKILNVFEPSILTIPEDSTVFSLVQKGTAEYYKLIMENYIGLMVYRDPVHMDVFLRFDICWNWSGFQGFIYSFMPWELIQDQDEPIKIIKNMIDNDFCIMCFVDKFYISFYPEYRRYHSAHNCMIYGYDEKNECIYCKDYRNKVFEKYEMTFTEFETSLKNYDVLLNRDIGLFGIKVNKDIDYKIDYSKFYNELIKFKYSRKIDNNVYGKDVFSTLIDWLKEAEREGKTSLYRWYDTANYLKSNAVFMEERVKLLKMNFPQMRYVEIDEHVKKLLYTTDLFFMKALKTHMKNDESIENLNKQYELLKNIFIPYIGVVDELILLLEEIFLYD